METKEALAESPYPGIERLGRAQADLETALQSCANAVSCLSPADGGLPHTPPMAFAVGAIMSAVGNLELAKIMLGEVHDTAVQGLPVLAVHVPTPPNT